MKITILAAAALVAWNADLQKRPTPSSYDNWIVSITAAQSGARDAAPEVSAFTAWNSHYSTK
jgi:hypothetical protein